jgi:hypothetical protein
LARAPPPKPPIVPPPLTATRPAPPVVGEVNRLLEEGKIGEALIRGYLTAETDVRQAFGLPYTRYETHREFLRTQLRPDMGYLAVLLPRLYALYEPVRYGKGHTVAPEIVRDLVRAIFNEGPIFNLYRDPNYARRFTRPAELARAGVGSLAAPRPTDGGAPR